MNQAAALEPWWVEGAEVNAVLETVALFAGLARFTVNDVENTDGFCLREQLYYDGLGSGFNIEAGALMRKVAKLR